MFQAVKNVFMLEKKIIYFNYNTNLLFLFLFNKKTKIIIFIFKIINIFFNIYKFYKINKN